LRDQLFEVRPFTQRVPDWVESEYRRRVERETGFGQGAGDVSDGAVEVTHHDARLGGRDEFVRVQRETARTVDQP